VERVYPTEKHKKESKQEILQGVIGQPEKSKESKWQLSRGKYLQTFSFPLKKMGMLERKVARRTQTNLKGLWRSVSGIEKEGPSLAPPKGVHAGRASKKGVLHFL